MKQKTINYSISMPVVSVIHCKNGATRVKPSGLFPHGGICHEAIAINLLPETNGEPESNWQRPIPARAIVQTTLS